MRPAHAIAPIDQSYVHVRIVVDQRVSERKTRRSRTDHQIIDIEYAHHGGGPYP